MYLSGVFDQNESDKTGSRGDRNPPPKPGGFDRGKHIERQIDALAEHSRAENTLIAHRQADPLGVPIEQPCENQEWEQRKARIIRECAGQKIGQV